MNNIKLFKIDKDKTIEQASKPYAVERDLQKIFEDNLNCLLGVRFLKSEYQTGKRHSGRIDTLGIDENFCPVIIEYKRHSRENIINQGLFYFDWLLDHKAEFELLVRDTLNKETADKIDWSQPRLICIANDFTKYDTHAVQQIDKNIELFKYEKFGGDFLTLTLITIPRNTPSIYNKEIIDIIEKKEIRPRLKDEHSREIKKLLDEVEDFILSLGDDVVAKKLKHYIAYCKIRNFVCIEPQKLQLKLTLPLNPDDCEIVKGFSQDLRTKGHLGIGDFGLSIKNYADIQKAKDYIKRAYDKI